MTNVEQSGARVTFGTIAADAIVRSPAVIVVGDVLTLASGRPRPLRRLIESASEPH